MVVLCDTDVVVLEDPRGLALPPESIAGKLVDAPVPPFEVILDIFAAAGVATPPSVSLPWGAGQRTVVGNSNGGLYLVPGALLPRVATAWAGWARWLLDHLDLFQQWTVYIDQVAMAMALADTGPGRRRSRSAGIPRSTIPTGSRPTPPSRRSSTITSGSIETGCSS